MPHGYCFLWNVPLTLMHVIADGAIAIAYFSIPTLMYLSRHRATETIRPLVVMFAAFILACGISHVFSAWNIWHGNYWSEGVWKGVTALISLATAWQLRRALPDIMGIHKTLEETERLANIDALTGLQNRRGLETALAQVQSTFSLQHIHHVLMLVDLDNFKEVNDAYGHPMGDHVLKSVAQELRLRTRSVDIVARLGGDEFAILLVGCSLPHSQQIAEDIRQAIAKIRLEIVDPVTQSGPAITTSIGLVPIQQPDLAFEMLYQAADFALYRSKHNGRNQVSVFQAEKNSGNLPACLVQWQSVGDAGNS